MKEYFTAYDDCVRIMRVNTTPNDTMLVMSMLGRLERESNESTATPNSSFCYVFVSVATIRTITPFRFITAMVAIVP